MGCTRTEPRIVASGVILPVGIPTAMGLYALIKKDQPMLKDAIYIGTSVIEAVGITYAAKHNNRS